MRDKGIFERSSETKKEKGKRANNLFVYLKIKKKKSTSQKKKNFL